MPTGGIRTRTSGIMIPAFVAPATATTATWNNSDRDPDVTLSNGFLTAAATTNVGGVRATASHSTGKYFFKITLDTAGTGGNAVTVGFENGVGSLGVPPSSPDAPGGGFAHEGETGNIFGTNGTFGGFNLTPHGTFPAVTGDIISIAVDLTANLAWWRVNSGNWNNFATDDPGTGSGGLDISAANALKPFFPAVFFQADAFANPTITADFSGSGAPSGFGPW